MHKPANVYSIPLCENNRRTVGSFQYPKDFISYEQAKSQSREIQYPNALQPRRLSNSKSHGLESQRDLAIKHLVRYWPSATHLTHLTCNLLKGHFCSLIQIPMAFMPIIYKIVLSFFNVLLPVWFMYHYIVSLFTCITVYLFIYWKSGTSHLLVLMPFVLQCTGYE